jgi:hypothetical protein
MKSRVFNENSLYVNVVLRLYNLHYPNLFALIMVPVWIIVRHGLYQALDGYAFLGYPV